MKRFVGWDCAVKTLAHIVVKVRGDFPVVLPELVGKILQADDEHLPAHVAELAAYLDSAIAVESVGVHDISGGCGVKDADPAVIARNLRQLIDRLNIDPDGVFIEEQPRKIGLSTNTAAMAVSHQLAYAFADPDAGAPVCVHFVDNKLKQKFSFGGHKYEDILEEILAGIDRTDKKKVTSARYRAGKKHTELMFVHVMGLLRADAMLKSIPRKLYNHAADALFTLLAGLGSTDHSYFET
jgi:hypothetical protein